MVRLIDCSMLNSKSYIHYGRPICVNCTWGVHPVQAVWRDTDVDLWTYGRW